MSAPTLHVDDARASEVTRQGLRLRLKPAHCSRGLVQGAWWPRSDQLHSELPQLLAALSPRTGTVHRVVYDESAWSPAALRMEYRGLSVILEGSRTESINTLSLSGDGFGRLVLLVVPPYTSPSRAYTAVMTASDPEDASTVDELLGIGVREAQDRRQALLAHHRWESEGGALRGQGQNATQPPLRADTYSAPRLLSAADVGAPKRPTLRTAHETAAADKTVRGSRRVGRPGVSTR